MVANRCEIDENYEVTIEELKKYGDENYIQIYMVSTLLDIGIKEMFEDCANQYADYSFENIKNTF